MGVKKIKVESDDGSMISSFLISFDWVGKFK